MSLNSTLHLGCCRDWMRQIEPWSIDSIVTDPPYGLSFMGAKWDGQVPGVEYWQEALHVAKPGAYLVAFGGTRTWHRLAVAIEDAGWEIRDTIGWLYGSGFPKSKNLGGGKGSALKPAWEPIILARAPLQGSLEDNDARYGVGGIHVDRCRIEVLDEAYARNCSGDRGHGGTRGAGPSTDLKVGGGMASNAGRWPANVLLDEPAAIALDASVGVLKSGANPERRNSAKFKNAYGAFAGQEECVPARGADEGGPSRFFYCAKAGRAERNLGCEDLDERELNWSKGDANPGSFQSEGTNRSVRNDWPTVKPVKLMRWLCRLVTPPGGLILDPFVGSGSTGVAAELEGFNFIGIDREERAIEISRRRIAAVRGGLHGA